MYLLTTGTEKILTEQTLKGNDNQKKNSRAAIEHNEFLNLCKIKKTRSYKSKNKKFEK